MKKVIGVHGGMYEICDDWKKPLSVRIISEDLLEFLRTASVVQLLEKIEMQHYDQFSQLALVYEMFFHGRLRAAAELAQALVRQRSFFETTLRNCNDRWANALLETATEDLTEQV